MKSKESDIVRSLSNIGNEVEELVADLRSEIEEHKEEYNRLQQEYDFLYEENEKLKNTLSEYEEKIPELRL